MPYVKRDADGSIDGLLEQLQEGYAEEFLPDDNSEVIEFSEKAKAALAANPTIERIARAWDMTPEQVVERIDKDGFKIDAGSKALN
ncbi:hypothetical protein EHI44_24180 [Rhizobium leguminosarum]|uniref:hypothetical protein n=1 Tax=Rhizobium leguminosarum TaxID=384 RepID=UPI000FF7E79A|nr:hypothetical protein [Rhizobium leguminosarum]RWY82392.1 hypothetical protein EHI44_24180 [Rhizobium leguminosarum]